MELEVKPLNMEEMDEEVVSIRHEVQMLRIDLIKQNEVITKLNRLIVGAKNSVDAHINRRYAEIRVIEADGTWGDYSGQFYLDDNVHKEEVLKKAETHFENFFVDGHELHRNKKMGLFVFSPRSGLQLVKEMETK